MDTVKEGINEFLARGGKITKLKYRGPKEPKTNVGLKRKNSIKGKLK